MAGVAPPLWGGAYRVQGGGALCSPPRCAGAALPGAGLYLKGRSQTPATPPCSTHPQAQPSPRIASRSYNCPQLSPLSPGSSSSWASSLVSGGGVGGRGSSGLGPASLWLCRALGGLGSVGMRGLIPCLAPLHRCPPRGPGPWSSSGLVPPSLVSPPSSTPSVNPLPHSAPPDLGVPPPPVPSHHGAPHIYPTHPISSVSPSAPPDSVPSQLGAPPFAVSGAPPFQSPQPPVSLPRPVCPGPSPRAGSSRYTR